MSEFLSARLVAIFTTFICSIVSSTAPLLLLKPVNNQHSHPNPSNIHNNKNNNKEGEGENSSADSWSLSQYIGKFDVNFKDQLVWWRVLRCGGAGVILGVSILHLLVESSEALETVVEYPLAYVLFLVGFVFSLLIEQVALAVVKYVKTRMQLAPRQIVSGVASENKDCEIAMSEIGHSDDATSLDSASVSRNHDHCHNIDHSNSGVSSCSTGSHENYQTLHNHEKTMSGACEGGSDFHHHYHVHLHDEIVDKCSSKDALIKASILEAAVAIHSVIIGFDLGVLPSNNLATIKVLTAALCFHQLFEGISIGTSLHETNLTTKSKFWLAMFFSLTLPVGICLGIAFKGQQTEEGEIAAGCASAIAAGSMLYSVFTEMISEDFTDPAVSSRNFVKVLMFLSLCLGIAVMAVLAIWA